MIGKMTDKLRNNKMIRKVIRPVYFYYIDVVTAIRIRMDIRKLKKLPESKKRIFLFGIPTAANIGDMTQYLLILKWLKNNYPEYDVVDFPTRSILYQDCRFLNILDKKLKKEDYIFFQSGYDTHDLGGDEDLMHKTVISHFPEQNMVMLPQTVFFQSAERERESAEAYSKNKGMLFLARDKMSYQKALTMFPDLRVKLYPDIVTTLIGKYHFTAERKGVLFCHRSDGERYYSAEEWNTCKENIRRRTIISSTDTTIPVPNMFVRKNVTKYLNRMLNQFSQYQVIITDRYHGTILSLVAQTPVIVIKTTDHKVTSGLDWFAGIYDAFIYLAKDLKDAEDKAAEWLEHGPKGELPPYFEEKYYSHLKELIEEKA